MAKVSISIRITQIRSSGVCLPPHLPCDKWQVHEETLYEIHDHHRAMELPLNERVAPYQEAPSFPSTRWRQHTD